MPGRCHIDDAGGEGANPEQLFAAGYSACFIGAMKFVAAREKVALPTDVSIEATVGIGPISAGFGIDVDLKMSLPGMAREVAVGLHTFPQAPPGVVEYIGQRKEGV